MAPLLSAEDVSFTYPDGTQAIKNASLYVDEGEIVALIGPNGSGKSTLLLLLAGLLEPLTGRILYKGVDIKALGVEYRREIGVLFQDPSDMLFASSSYDDIAFPLRQIGLDESEIKTRILDVSRRLGIKHLLNKPPYKLSGGEMKKVALASILVLDPKILILDEPSSELSAADIDVIIDIMSEYRGNKRSIILASHDIEFVSEIADRVYLIKDGTIIADGDKSILGDPELLRQIGFKPPAAVQVYKRIINGDSSVPLTLNELIRFLERYCSKRL